MDKSSEYCGFIKDGKIRIRLLKGLKNNNWVVNNRSNTGLAVAEKRPTQVKPSLPVSLPIEIYWRAMQTQRKSDDRIHERRSPSPPSAMMTPPTPPIAMMRPSPPPSDMMRPPALLNLTGLRMVRLPTDRARITMANKLEQKIKNPGPIHPTAQENTASEPPINIHVTLPSNKQPDENHVDEINTATNKIGDKRFNSLTSIKHSLRLGVVPSKGSYNSRIMDKDIKINNSCCTQTISTVQATAQTDKIFIVIEEDFKMLQSVKSRNITEEDFQILELVKESGATKYEVGKQLDRLKKQKEKKNDSEVVIDLESDTEENSKHNDMIQSCFKQSNSNKNFLNASIIVVNYLKNMGFPLLTTASISPVHKEHSTATPEQPPGSTVNEESPSLPDTIFPKSLNHYSEIMNSLNLLGIAQKSAERLACNAQEQQHTMVTNTQCTQTEDDNNNKRRKRADHNHYHFPFNMMDEQNSFQQGPLITDRFAEPQQTNQGAQQTALKRFQQLQLPPPQSQPSKIQHQSPQMHIPQLHPPQIQKPLLQPTQMQTIHVQPKQLQFNQYPYPPPQNQTSQFQPIQMQSQQIQLSQLPQRSPPQFQITQPYVAEERPSNNMQKRTQIAAKRNYYQNLCEENRPSTNTEQTAATLMHPHPNDPSRQSLHTQMTFVRRAPHRVLSTQEANLAMHGSQAAPQSESNWPYPRYYDRQGESSSHWQQ